MSRTLQGVKVETFEFMRLVVNGKGATFHLQPNGAPPILFCPSALGDGWIEVHHFRQTGAVLVQDNLISGDSCEAV